LGFPLDIVTLSGLLSRSVLAKADLRGLEACVFDWSFGGFINTEGKVSFLRGEVRVKEFLLEIIKEIKIVEKPNRRSN